MRSVDGHLEAGLIQQGTHTDLLVRRDDVEHIVRLRAGFHRPDRIFWMYDEKAIGVDYADDCPVDDKIVYFDLFFRDPMTLTKEDGEKMRFANPLTPEEQQAFEQTKQAVLRGETRQDPP
ncbi:MAG: hypothetical protein JW818_15045 [Pirellulales bacterium]|nr:hypothetical protein [Pirellulales bacterium]